MITQEQISELYNAVYLTFYSKDPESTQLGHAILQELLQDPNIINYLKSRNEKNS